ncbi:MAG: hypothetical protein K2H25_02520, partial [Alistipes sp.]|nr:hypothetical protein [Alistipes sp.]
AGPASGVSRVEYVFHDRLGSDHYAVESPDALLPADDNATVVMRYAENGRTAGIAATGNGRSFVMSIPFEALTTQRERDRLMREALHFLMTE